MTDLPTDTSSPTILRRTTELFEHSRRENYARIDRLFVVLMLVQWVAGLAAAFWLSPRTWSGAMSQTHLHVWAAVVLGGLMMGLPAWLAWARPGHALTRHVVAIGQMLTSALLIHLTGGRIETHFHIFGSLAFLACYRDWRVIATATLVVIADHGLRGMLWPESVYGVISGTSLRFIEHSCWVVFEDIFLLITIQQSLTAMHDNAHQRAVLESTNSRIEQEVRKRTEELQAAIQSAAEANRQLEQANRGLAEKNHELDQFTYIASHDLQEPVRKLVSFSSLLEQDVEGELNEDAARDLRFIVDAAKRMKNLVQALLEFSRVGRSAMKQEPVDLNLAVDDALSALQMRLEDTGAEIIRDSLPTVVGDRTMLTQLYQNLLANSLKFVKDTTPIIEVTAVRDADRWVLGVKDNGIGMKSEYAERIFQPFQRLHNRGEYEGTGIGLSICKKTAQRHGGDIWVESEPGQGAHFMFSLPVRTTADLPDITPAAEPTPCTA